MTVGVSDNNKRLEAGALSSSGLLLHGHDLHALVLELWQKEVDNLVLLDGQREEIDLLDRTDVSVGNETAQLGDGHPLLLGLGPSPSSTVATTLPTATTLSPFITRSQCRVSLN